MTDEEKAAMKWLERWNPEGPPATIKSMLAQPRLPQEPSDDCLAAMRAHDYRPGPSRDMIREIYHALYHFLLTGAPGGTKTVWRVTEAQDGGRHSEHFDYDSLADALARVRVCVERHRIFVSIEPREVPA
jgi:hypothetical protein